MKQLFIFVGFVCLIVLLMPACSPAPEPMVEPAPEPVFDQAAEEAALRKVHNELNATWNAKDLEPHFALIDENYVMNDGEKGKAAHRKYLEQLWSSEDYSQYKFVDIDFVFVSPDVAIYRRHAEELKTNMNVTGAWIFSKNSGNWLLSATFWRPIEQ